jgi:hypothetical protein
MHRVNAGYTLLLPLREGSVVRAGELLGRLDRNVFERAMTIHFATLTIIPAQTYRDDQPLPATLLVATSFAGPADAHVKELVDLLGEPLRELFACCEGFDPKRDLAKFIESNRHDDTFYSGMQNLMPQDVLDHRKLRDEIERILDEEKGLPETPAGVRAAIQERIRSNPKFRWAHDPPKVPLSAFWALHWRTLIVMAIAAAFTGGLVVSTALELFVLHDEMLGMAVKLGWLAAIAFAGLLLMLVLGVREAEKEQKYVAERPPDQRVRELAATQNRPVINEFVIAGPIKKEGRGRPLVLRLLMWIVARLAEGIPWVRDGIDIPTVATARWIAADKGRRLIFISNYTNSAEPYVRDFIDVHDGAQRINLTFGFGYGYPKTEWVVNRGALTDPNGFIYVVTKNQYETGFWYGRYPDMSIDNIKINRRIREGLFAKLDEDETREWLALL